MSRNAKPGLARLAPGGTCRSQIAGRKRRVEVPDAGAAQIAPAKLGAMTVVVLEDAAEDLESGRRFYESHEPGIGDYFIESILSDLSSLVLYSGMHPVHFGLYRMLSKRFPFGILL